MSSDINICYLINGLAPAGAEHQLLEIVRGVEQNVEFTIFHFGWGTELESEFRKAGANIKNMNFLVPYDPLGISRFVRECLKNNFDLIHAHLPSSMPIGRFAGLITDTPVVCTHHNVSDNYQLVSKLLERVSRRIDMRTIAVSNGVRVSFSDSTPKKWQTIYNGINVDKYRSNIKYAEPTETIRTNTMGVELVLLNIARYSPQKRQQDLIESFAAVVDDLPSAHLFIVGWGDLQPELEQKVKAEGVSEYVTITGRVPEVEPYYQAADLFVSSSLREGLPITFLEAMAAGLPILATDIPGVREVVVTGETGLLVGIDQPSSIQDGLRRIITEYNLELMGKKAVKRVRQNFSIQNTIDQHIELYTNITSDR